MKPKWLIEHFDDRNSTHLLIEEVKRQGYECKTIEYLPFMSGSTDVFNEWDCVITQTSINLALQVQRDKPEWIPGPWMTAAKYKCSEYYAHLGNYLFNDKYIMMPRSEVLRNIDRLYGWVGNHSHIFMRPDSGLKSFTGKIFDRKNFDADWKWVEEFTEPSSLVVISTPKDVIGEWRFVVSNKTVITGSQYNIDGKHTCSPGYPDAAFWLAHEVAQVYQPDAVFVIDICLGGDGKYYLLEIGAFSCAGLYACDMQKIVEHMSCQAEVEWEAYNAMNSREFIPHEVPNPDKAYPHCTVCGGRLMEVRNEPIPSNTSYELPDSMKNRKWLFSGDRCVDCERRVRGSYFEIK